jgi:hypothetical protein
MLGDFQQALADLTASPDLCVSVRRDPSLLHRRYELTEREWRRVVAIAKHPGMQCACIVYRANRLAPLALNVPQLCKALGKDLRAVASEYWSAFPEANVHFYVEADRFCRFLKKQIEEGRTFAPEVESALQREGESVAAALQESYTEGREQ